MLSDRRQKILYALIEEYVAHALPVGSQTIAKQYKLGVSSATIRNELSVLEDQGYIAQPHTSAGRIPTDAGYREFVDTLLNSKDFKQDNAYSSIVSSIKEHADALDSLIERTSEELTKLTDCLSIVMAPQLTSTTIRQISLISLSNRQALIIIVSQDGNVIEKTIIFDIDVDPETLYGVQAILTSVLVGRSTNDIDAISNNAVKDLASDPVTGIILKEIIGLLQEGGSVKTARVGMSSLLRKPEFHDSSALLPIMEVLEDNTVLFRVVDSHSENDSDIIVRIGRENEAEQLAGASVIAGKYGRGDAQGVIAVIGPKRMDYTRVISAVRAAQDILKNE